MKLLTNKLLETFCAVVECGGFTDAQYKLGLTQSAISCRIRDLEIILGYRVCERGRRGFYLTERGQIAYDKAQAILRSVRDFDTELLELRQVITGDLRVGIVDAVSSLPDLNLSSAIERFYARTDQVRLELMMASPVELTQRLISGSLHVGIAPFRNRVSDLSYVELFSEDHSLYCGQAHPLYTAPAETITADVLAGYPVCQRTYDLSLTADWSKMGPLAYVSNMEAVFVLVSSGRFLGALPDHYAKTWVETVELRLLCADSFSWVSKFYLATRPESARRRAVDLFIQDILQTIEKTKSEGASAAVSRVPAH